jgi:hypothetical protein
MQPHRACSLGNSPEWRDLVKALVVLAVPVALFALLLFTAVKWLEHVNAVPMLLCFVISFVVWVIGTLTGLTVLGYRTLRFWRPLVSAVVYIMKRTGDAVIPVVDSPERREIADDDAGDEPR